MAAISGPVGTFASIDPRVEAYVAAKLGLSPEPVSTQVIPRDRHAMFFATLAVIAAGIERLATEVRHLQRSEVREAEEFFHPGQKGSSSMPHKRNPVLSENLTGLARVVRAAVVPALENVTLWHERDISHSSVERVIAPDATIALDFALVRLAGMMQRLLVYPERMAANLESLGGVVLLGRRAAGAGASRHLARGRLCHRPAQRDGDMGKAGRRRRDAASATICWMIRTWRGGCRRRNSMRRWMGGLTWRMWITSSPVCSARLSGLLPAWRQTTR